MFIRKFLVPLFSNDARHSRQKREIMEIPGWNPCWERWWWTDAWHSMSTMQVQLFQMVFSRKPPVINFLVSCYMGSLAGMLWTDPNRLRCERKSNPKWPQQRYHQYPSLQPILGRLQKPRELNFNDAHFTQVKMLNHFPAFQKGVFTFFSGVEKLLHH